MYNTSSHVYFEYDNDEPVGIHTQFGPHMNATRAGRLPLGCGSSPEVEERRKQDPQSTVLTYFDASCLLLYCTDRRHDRFSWLISYFSRAAGCPPKGYKYHRNFWRRRRRRWRRWRWRWWSSTLRSAPSPPLCDARCLVWIFFLLWSWHFFLPSSFVKLCIHVSGIFGKLCVRWNFFEIVKSFKGLLVPEIGKRWHNRFLFIVVLCAIQKVELPTRN